MMMALRVALTLLGLLYGFMGLELLTDPVGAGGDFGVTATGPQGLATIRGDLTAFFWVLGGSLTIGAWRSNASLLYVGAALAGIVLAARGISAGIDGTYDQWFVPMVVEAVTVVLAVVAARVLDRT